MTESEGKYWACAIVDWMLFMATGDVRYLFSSDKALKEFSKLAESRKE